MADAPTRWASRIVGHGAESPDQLLASPWNHRIHPTQQKDALLAMLDEVGWIRSVVVSRKSGIVVDGHLRVSAALLRGEPTVPVDYVDLTPEEEVKIVSLFDALGAMATLDPATLDKALEAVFTTRPVLMTALSNLHSVAHHLPQMDHLFPPPILGTPPALGAPEADPGALGRAALSADPGFIGGAAGGGSGYTGGTGHGGGDFGDFGDDGDGPDADALPENHVRMVQLFLSSETHPVFLDHEARLRVHFGTDNATDTVLRALAHVREGASA